MRFHKSESAFFVFIFVILAAGVVTLHAYDALHAIADGLIDTASMPDEVDLLSTSCCSRPACFWRPRCSSASSSSTR